MDIRFQHPEFFIALLVVPLAGLLFWRTLKWKRSTVARIGDVTLVKELIRGYSFKRSFVRFMLIAAALGFIILSIIDPMRPGGMDKVERKGVDVMIALDVSNSMLAEDIAPNRLERARQLVYNLMDRLGNDRVGLILFAGRAYMQMPLTTDHAAARMYVQNASPSAVPTQGTMLSEAMKLAAAAFNSKERKYKAVVVISDGEDHDPASAEVAAQLAESGVMVNTVGVGSPVGTAVPNPATGQLRKDALGNTVLSKLNEEALKLIAATTQGVYVNAVDDGDALEKIAAQLATIEEVAPDDTAFRDNIHYFHLFAALALILLVIELLLPERKLQTA